MLLTPAQLHEIRQIIQDYHFAFIANVISPTAVAPDILKRLKEKGLLDIQIESIKDAYIYGILLAHLENPAVAMMTYQQFQNHLKKNPVPLTPVEHHAIAMAEAQAGQYCKGLGNKVDVTTGQTLINADSALRTQMHATIRTNTAEAIERRESVQQLKSKLGWATGDWARDWKRIANTEMQQAMQTGLADRYKEKHGSEARVAKVPMPDACEHCKRLFLGNDGKPRIFALADLQTNGTNVGRKTAEWLPVVGTVHPHCQCQLIRVPAGWGFDAAGDLVPGGKFGELGKSEDFLECLRAEEEFHKSLLGENLLDFQGLPIRIENSAGSLRTWKDPQGNIGETQMLCAYGEIIGTAGADGDPIDVFVGPDPAAPNVFIVHQQVLGNGIYDEEKVMLGFASEEFALQVYQAHFNEAGHDASVTSMAMDAFQRWIAETAPTDEEMMNREDPILVIPVLEKADAPYMGPKGGKWADPEHKHHWEGGGGGGERPAPEEDEGPVGAKQAQLPEHLQKRLTRRSPGKGEHVQLSKEELHAVLTSGRFALVSAGPNPKFPEDARMTPADIANRTNQLRKQLEGDGFAYTDVVGHYSGQEPSFLVMIHDAEREHVLKLGEMFNQDSVIFSEAGHHELHWTTGENAGHFVAGNGYQEVPDAEDLYTEFPHPEGDVTKFQLNLDFETLHKLGEELAPALQKSGLPAIIGAETSMAGHRNPGRGTATNFLFNTPRRTPPKQDPKVFDAMIEVEEKDRETEAARKRRRRNKHLWDVTKPVPDHVFILAPPTERAYENVRDGRHEERKATIKQWELDNCGLLNEDHVFIRKGLKKEDVTPVGGVTPGGYKKIAEDKYVKVGPGGGQAAPPVAAPSPAPKGAPAWLHEHLSGLGGKVVPHSTQGGHSVLKFPSVAQRSQFLESHGAQAQLLEGGKYHMAVMPDAALHALKPPAPKPPQAKMPAPSLAHAVPAASVKRLTEFQKADPQTLVRPLLTPGLIQRGAKIKAFVGGKSLDGDLEGFTWDNRPVVSSKGKKTVLADWSAVQGTEVVEPRASFDTLKHPDALQHGTERHKQLVSQVMEIPVFKDKKVADYLSWIREHGGEGYLVGGAVRDMLAGTVDNSKSDAEVLDAMHDVDIVTTLSARRHRRMAGEVAGTKAKGDYDGVTSEWDHWGVLTIGQQGEGLDVSCMGASDTFGEDENHQAKGVFDHDITKDTERRDFACNALYYDPINHTIIDPTGNGVADAQNKVLRIASSDENFFQNEELSLRFWKFRGRGYKPIKEELPRIVEHAQKILSAWRKTNPKHLIKAVAKTVGKGKKSKAEIVKALQGLKDVMHADGAGHIYEKNIVPFEDAIISKALSKL